jgi:chromosome segregation ATPase
MVVFATINPSEAREPLDTNGKGGELEYRARSPNSVFYAEICGPAVYSPRSEVEDELLLDKTTLSDVDELLQDKNEADAADYMRHMIADLLNEVEVLKIKMEESQQEVSTLKQQRRAMQLEVSPRRKFNMNSNSKMTLSMEQAHNISVQDATCLVVANLTKKVEDLNSRQDEIMNERNSLIERVEDLTCQNSAYELKISALELQFKSINKTRQKAVQRLISGSSYSPVLDQKSSPRVQFDSSSDLDESS